MIYPFEGFDPEVGLVVDGTMGLASSQLFVSNGYAAFTWTINGNFGRVVLKFQGNAE